MRRVNDILAVVLGLIGMFWLSQLVTSAVTKPVPYDPPKVHVQVAVSPWYVLVDAIIFGDVNHIRYTGQMFPTEAACVAFVKSPEFQAALEDYKKFVQAQDPHATLVNLECGQLQGDPA